MRPIGPLFFLLVLQIAGAAHPAAADGPRGGPGGMSGMGGGPGGGPGGGMQGMSAGGGFGGGSGRGMMSGGMGSSGGQRRGMSGEQSNGRGGNRKKKGEESGLPPVDDSLSRSSERIAEDLAWRRMHANQPQTAKPAGGKTSADRPTGNIPASSKF